MGLGAMPKELVNDTISKQFRIETSWGRNDGCVQIATTHADADRTTVDMLNELLEEVGMPKVDWPELQRRAREKKLPTFFNGWHVTITDRDRLNELIRIVRRARDHAFGRDE
jgi:hypothetical protein